MRKNPCTRHKFNSSGEYCLRCHAGRKKLNRMPYPRYSTVPPGYYTDVIKEIIDAVKHFEALQKPMHPKRVTSGWEERAHTWYSCEYVSRRKKIWGSYRRLDAYQILNRKNRRNRERAKKIIWDSSYSDTLRSIGIKDYQDGMV